MPYWLINNLFSVSMFEIRETMTAIVKLDGIVEVALDRHDDDHELLVPIGVLVDGDDDDWLGELTWFVGDTDVDLWTY